MSEPGRRQQEIPRESMTTEEITAANPGPAPKLNGQVTLADYDPRWPEAFEREAAAIRARLRVPGRRIEHVGSTSVPGLLAKPVVDMLLIVPDSADEAAYLPILEGLGFELVIREPGWYEHRVLRKYDLGLGADAANLHVLSDGCPEVDRMLLFRDRLRRDAADRTLYAETKRFLAQQTWEYLQNYADAKTEVVEQILARAVHGT
ncbi:GrpB family protein [Streptomyces sp. URMC 124]|uniref:GrpB family protein n=1 Tax=Streptomyces sp. URMC 124 TaxID=3423405 RepID=UPI003F1AF612